MNLPEKEKPLSPDMKIKIAEGEVLKKERSDIVYGFWWHIQMITLIIFLISLVLSLVWRWWMLVPAFLFLGINLYANFSRLNPR